MRPEDSGAGFSDVGALGKAKEALREVVQLPLQHPSLFAAGSLAKHCKGVLLFGPPGNFWRQRTAAGTKIFMPRRWLQGARHACISTILF